ncbi:glycosyltransferase [Algoriphagus sp. H41]|uniref:Glycosyltransferase n=1 Tax=Algoriphagus oliviformis TaxID=2811231 RepID=A0ABS3C8K4_9BACT|nr:glycosyltransferase [Algoriphagus oliviformis]MBN7812909.1 glycosyltransferase [Algoriphagus oliviformis]
MRILQLIDSLDTGGAEMMAVNISNALHEDGNPVILCASRRGGALLNRKHKQVPYICLNKANSLDFRALFRLVALAKRENIELIHAHSSSVFWALFVKLALFGRVQVLWHDHFGNRVHEKANVFMVLCSYLLDYAICVNEELKNWSLAHMKIPQDHIAQINNFPALTISRKSGLETMDSPKIVYLASFREPKNHLNAIQAFQKYLQLGNPNAQLILAGKYHQNTYYQQVTDYIQSQGLSGKVQLTGNVEDVGLLLSEMHIGIISSDFEGLPVSLLEYGLAALPVVVTEVGECPKVLDYGRFGKIVEKGNPLQLAEALHDLVGNWEQAIATGREFRSHVDENYGTRNFLSTYYHLIKGNR